MNVEATSPRVLFPYMLRYLVRTNGLLGAAGKLAQVPDDAIDRVVNEVPGEWVPSADVRNRLKANLKTSRDAVAKEIERTYGSA